ncbi:MAG TPA: PQQ-dependent sugar dehydrogenase [Flavitalea sp.]|nr:PQQ-dependent sugar dehydrogenase [Flavitalea sp.]
MNKNLSGATAIFLLIICCLTLPAAAQETGWHAPSWADTTLRPFPVTKSVIAEGKSIYSTYCMACHGKEGNGKGAPGMTFEVQPANFHDRETMLQKDGSLFWKITKGHGAMPGFATSLTELQRWKVVTYLREFTKDKNGKLPPPFEHSLPIAGYSIDRSTTSNYFPVPAKVKNVVGSQTMSFMVDTVVRGMTLPWSIAFLPDSQTVVIAERSGNLLLVKNGKKQSKPVSGDIPTSLRDIALHPDFEKNHLVYLSYYIEPVNNADTTKRKGGFAVIMRGTLEDDVLKDTQILYKCGPFREDGFWYGNMLAFDKETHLYVTIGQRTIRNMHRWNTAQDKSVISGKIIRLNDDGSIPKDNPFVDSSGALPEIYTLGHRQPEGLIYDRHTGTLWENEHGENGGCELNIIGAGKNYGWPKTTFSINYNGTIITTDTVLPGMELPARYWRPALAPAGMDFVYGDRYPGWNGNLIIGSLVQKKLNRTIMNGDKAIGDESLIQGIGRVRDVVFAPDGFLYVLTEDTGLLIRILPVKKGVGKITVR